MLLSAPVKTSATFRGSIALQPYLLAVYASQQSLLITTQDLLLLAG